jgi:hypothetical protein
MRRILIAIAALAGLPTTLPVTAQIPDTFTNLQVLPKDISKGELVGLMRGYAGSLGVRCAYCHVGPDNLEGMDFATDKRPAKQTARRMLQMVQAINGQHLNGIETSSTNRVEVTCKTCHRGITSPRQIEDIILAVLQEEGYDAGTKRYTELRESYYGRAAYDFGPQPLNAIAESLFRGGQQEEAIRLTQMNNDLHPDYPYSRTLLGRFHAWRGEKEKAIAAFEEALKLDPESEWVQQQIERLKAPAEGSAEAPN